MADEAPNYKHTLSITKTDFAQKANLPQREPERLARWREIGLEDLIAEKGKDREPYVLHDGPPYANGDIHLGHALNKTLKDIVVRYKTMRGYRARYVPGFDCHGLPIEQKVLERIKGKDEAVSKAEIRAMCHEYATRYIGLQTEQFQRLGVGGDWEQPYLTLDPQYEVGILAALREMVARGYVYRGFKPVWWDPAFRTALAEAELEYQTHTSPSIYVRFPIVDGAKCGKLEGLGEVNVVIWTTTPWTLPGDQAVTVHPALDYCVFESNGEKIVAAEGLVQRFVGEAGLGEPHILERMKGSELEGIEVAHPLLDKTVPVILGEHVTLEQGTGCVHTAPGHGPEDFMVCREYGIEAVVPVDEKGCFNEHYPEMQGEHVWKANPKIVEMLREKGILVWAGEIEHEYPYSWRSHQPVIVRATEQWFMHVDHDDLRAKCLDAIDNEVQWVPAWGHDRIYNMMANRPDWCLSRQRAWGVPLPVLRSKKTGESVLAPEVIDRFMELVAEHGTDCWFTMPAEAFVPEGFACPAGGTEFEKEYDILDVWFDSGSSHIAVLEQDLQLRSPADLYLEGSDQHRGWFMSSLTVSMATRDRAPYRTVLTHGFLLIAKGEAMSKSKGNVISPLDIIDRMGADVLRLWVISEDYRSDVVASEDILKQVQEAYRRIRNTLRFMLGNLTDFDAEKDYVEPAERAEIDRWALTTLARLIDNVARAYDSFEFHRIYHQVHQYCAVTLSAQYLDILKDRLYCSGPRDTARRAAQSTIHDLFSVIVRMMAPVMPFTCDEAYEYASPRRPCVHLEDFPDAPEAWRDDALAARWDRLLAVRETAMRPLEEARRAKEIGKSLDASVRIVVKARDLAHLLEGREELMREMLIVSACTIETGELREGETERMEEVLEVEVSRAEGEKCARCWTFDTRVGRDDAHPALCPRCADVVRRIT